MQARRHSLAIRRYRCGTDHAAAAALLTWQRGQLLQIVVEMHTGRASTYGLKRLVINRVNNDAVNYSIRLDTAL